MSTLTLMRDGQLISVYTLSQGRIRIGRDPACELVLADSEISRVHATIQGLYPGHRLIDNSTNGTFVNGGKSKVSRLKNKDKISAGPFELIYHAQNQEQALPCTVNASSARVNASYDNQHQRLISEQDVFILRDGSSLPSAYVPGQNIRVGKSPDCDLILQGASLIHCELSRVNNGYRLTPLDGATLSNGRPALKDHILAPGQSLDIGTTKLEYLRESSEQFIEPLDDALFCDMVGRSEKMRLTFAEIQRFGPLKDHVLILGNTGTGKELAAAAIHACSKRPAAPFIAINCGAISEELAESELFGHERGAFTGALTRRQGAFEQAHGGTLFLDEIGELSPKLQVKLLRVLETSEVQRIGSHQANKVDVRVIAATHRDLGQEIHKGNFREDLFYRLFILTINLPSLQERRQDIPLLVRHFRNLAGEKRPLSTQAMAKLALHNWPGNVRELRNTLARAFATSTEDHIDSEHISLINNARVAPQMSSAHLRTLEDVERQAIITALQLKKTKTEAAEALGIARSTLHLKMKKYDLS